MPFKHLQQVQHAHNFDFAVNSMLQKYIFLRVHKLPNQLAFDGGKSQSRKSHALVP
jgi:hypothetical protein